MKEKQVFLKEAEALHNLRALEEIEKNPKISQRELSSRLGVALGITNSLLKTLVRKGLIKVSGENNRSLTYHLTHAGVLTKSRLAMEWTLNTIRFYRQAKLNIANKIMKLMEQGINTAVLYGDGELAEIAVIVASEAGLEIIGVISSLGDSVEIVEDQSLDYPRIDVGQLRTKPPKALIICTEIDEIILSELRKSLGSAMSVHRLV